MYEIEFSGIKNGEETEIIVLQAETANSVENSVAEESVANNSEASENETTSEYMTVFPSGFENLPENATLMERLAYGGKVALIGMATVFLILIIIWVLCALMGKVFGGAGKKSQSEDKAPKEKVSTAPVSETKTASNAASSSADYSTVAVVASAAIAAYRGEDTVNFNISSIRPCGNGAVTLAPETVAQIAASIACLEGKDTIDFTISSIRII